MKAITKAYWLTYTAVTTLAAVWWFKGLRKGQVVSAPASAFAMPLGGLGEGATVYLTVDSVKDGRVSGFVNAIDETRLGTHTYTYNPNAPGPIDVAASAVKVAKLPGTASFVRAV